MTRIVRFTSLLVILVLGVFGARQVIAEGTPTLSSTSEASEAIKLEDPSSKAAVREMVATLNDDQVRLLLIERLDAVAERNASSLESRSAFDVLIGGLQVYSSTALEHFRNLPQVPAVFVQLMTEIGEQIAVAGTGQFILLLLVSAGLGVAAHRLMTRLFRRRKQALFEEVGYTLGSVLRIIYSRLAIDLLCVGAFFLVSYGIWSASYPSPALLNQVGYAFLASVGSGWAAVAVMNFLFARNTDGLAFCATTPERATSITRSYSTLAAYIVGIHNTFYLLLIASEPHGGYEFMAALGYVMNVSMYVVAAMLLWFHRRTLTDVLLENQERVKNFIGGDITEEARRFAHIWPYIAMVLIGVKYLVVEIVINSTDVGQYSTPAVYMTFFILMLWPAFDANVNLMVALGTRATEDEQPVAAEARTQMQRGLLRVGRVFLISVVLYLLATMWGLDLLGLAEAGLGAQAAGRLFELLIVALMAYVLWEVVTIWSRHKLAGETTEGGEDGGGDMGGVGLSRTATLIPIFEKTAKGLIVLVTIFMALSELGVNIAPLLAGAGVVGLAVGFGAQTLVKDIVSGLFFLADDAFRVAEYIDVGGTMGTVEKISLRSLRLRHHRGLVHTIPYGEIPKLTNYSRDWVIMKLRFRVPFETDINKVKKIFKRIGQEMLEHPDIGGDFLQPFKSQGVAEMDDDAIVVRGKFMAKPGRQFMIRKEVYVRVQKAFDEEGIPFARKQVMVHIPGLDGRPENLDNNDVRRVAAAAADSTRRDEQEKGA